MQLKIYPRFWNSVYQDNFYTRVAICAVRELNVVDFLVFHRIIRNKLWIEFLMCEVEKIWIHCSKVVYVPAYRENSVTCAPRSMKISVTSSYCFHLYYLALLDVGALTYFELKILLRVGPSV